MDKKYTFIFALLFFCLSSSFIVGKTIFVAVDGNDEQKGDLNNPFRTIQKGINTIDAGDSLLIREGGYAIQEKIEIQLTGKPDSWIFIGSFPGEKVTVLANQFLDTVIDSPEYRKLRETGAITVLNSNYIYRIRYLIRI